MKECLMRQQMERINYPGIKLLFFFSSFIHWRLSIHWSQPIHQQERKRSLKFACRHSIPNPLSIWLVGLLELSEIDSSRQNVLQFQTQPNNQSNEAEWNGLNSTYWRMNVGAFGFRYQTKLSPAAQILSRLQLLANERKWRQWIQ